MLRGSELGPGACPTLTVLLRRTIRNHLRRSRPEKILNVFQRLYLQRFQACGLASGRISFASSRTAMLDRLLANGIEKGKFEKEGTWQDGARKISTDRRGRIKNKIILLFGLDIAILHQ